MSNLSSSIAVLAIENALFGKRLPPIRCDNAPVIFIHDPLGAGDTGVIAGLKCRNLTSDVSQQCRGMPGF